MVVCPEGPSASESGAHVIWNSLCKGTGVHQRVQMGKGTQRAGHSPCFSSGQLCFCMDRRSSGRRTLTPTARPQHCKH